MGASAHTHSLKPLRLRNGRTVDGPPHRGGFLPTVGLTNVKLWLRFGKLPADCREVVCRGQSVGVVGAEHPLAGSKGLLVQL
jgi:hypothetical protein